MVEQTATIQAGTMDEHLVLDLVVSKEGKKAVCSDYKMAVLMDQMLAGSLASMMVGRWVDC